MNIKHKNNLAIASAQRSTLNEWSALFDELDHLDRPTVIDARSLVGDVTEIDAYLLALRVDELRQLRRHRMAIVADSDLPGDVAFFIASGHNLGLEIESFHSLETAAAWAAGNEPPVSRADACDPGVSKDVSLPQPATAQSAPFTTVLLVDDDPQVRRIVAANLSNAGYRVLQATGAVEALDIAGQESFDLLMTDVFMPETNGVELVNELRRRGSDVAMMLISGHSREEVSRSCGELEGLRFVGKPFLKDELLSTVQHVIANHRATQTGA